MSLAEEIKYYIDINKAKHFDIFNTEKYWVKKIFKIGNKRIHKWVTKEIFYADTLQHYIMESN